MKKALLLALVLAIAGTATAHEVGKRATSTAMVMSSLLPGAGQFYLGNVGKGFSALGGELLWWGGAGGFFLAGRLSGQEALKATKPRADSLRTLEAVMYVGAGVFALVALGWRAVMVSDVHDAAIAHNYRHRFLELSAGLKPETDGPKLGLYHRF
jgi:hypothetical protein